jgi:DNA-binding transcriptional regulator YhcF (GntR family)
VTAPSGKHLRYIEIADDIRDRIWDGKLPPGTRIGTFGSLGTDYGAAKGTVDKALDVLRQEGAVVTIAGKGIFVAGDAMAETATSASPSDQRLSKQIEALTEELRRLAGRVEAAEAHAIPELREAVAGLRHQSRTCPAASKPAYPYERRHRARQGSGLMAASGLHLERDRSPLAGTPATQECRLPQGCVNGSRRPVRCGVRGRARTIAPDGCSPDLVRDRVHVPLPAMSYRLRGGGRVPDGSGGPVDGGDEVASAACDAEAEQSWLLTEPGPRSIESLWDEAAGIAKAANRSALQTFGASRRIHSRALMLAEQTHRPAALADLYVIAGQATALMASTAFDLNRWDESATLARSAVSYATLVGNASLQAWSLGLSALLANWRKEPDTALSHFRRGLEVAPPGTPRARLRYIAARSYALLGDHASVSHVVDRARRDQGRGRAA